MKAHYSKDSGGEIGSCGAWMWWPVDGVHWRVRHDIGLLQHQFVDSVMFAVVDDFGSLVRVPL